MSASPASAAVRTLRRQLVLTLVVTALATGLVSLGVWAAARAEAHRTADRVAGQVADQVLGGLSGHDYRGLDAAERERTLAELAPFLTSRIVHRVKIWHVGAGDATIAVSDEPRLVGEVYPRTGQVDELLATGRTLVVAVPIDDEHRFETADADRLLEVFVPFRDAAGNDALLEMYVPVSVGEETRSTALIVLPLAVGGIVLLGLVLIPVGVGVGRDLDRKRSEHTEAVRYGLSAAERTRHELARDLHDDVLPGLASAGLLLDTARAGGDPELLGRARGLITDDVVRIRGLLDGYAGPAAGDDLAGTLEGLAARFPGVAVRAASRIDADPGTVELLHRVTAELLRNAVAHAGADRILVRAAAPAPGTVELEVGDDGAGFDPRLPPGPGHVGLALVRHAVADAGGRLSIASTPGAGTTVTVVVPAAVPHRPLTATP